ncbi:glycoside hydrolase family protein [uncultured Lutibacter sp.]|uniref:glycoside hydrolase family protein n=1 Tax=uncultured Lutibacter sp. TaxID=437739 RepID=UPI002616492F|nr:glycoside hydrolase family protein [uncultured Lutibacter sp.]
MKIKHLTLLLCFLQITISAQKSNSIISDTRIHVIERNAPSKWDSLVYGGRFLDRYLPMPDLGGITDNTWGGNNVVPREVNNGIENPVYDYWGGNARLADDGKYHLFVARWPQSTRRLNKGKFIHNRTHLPFGFSNTVHAIADNPFGPYKVIDDLGYGHNTEWYISKEGKYVVYVIPYAYVSDNVTGPWTRYTLEYDSRDRRDPNAPGDYLTNNTFAQREDGSFLMVNRHGDVWFSKTGMTSYQRVSTDCIYPNVDGEFEDPVIWRDNIQYHLIVNDWQGRIAYYMRSKDGVKWKWDDGEAYIPGITVQKNGIKEDWYKYERIKVTQDKYGRAFLANFAVSDTIKYLNKANDNHGCKNVFVPLTVGRLLSIENKKPINSKTKTIKVKVLAEDNFNPHTDIDFSSLSFGAPEKVDYGKGCKLQKTEKAGNDLILVFNGEGNGITNNNFTAKLIGKTSKGKLLFGFSHLPGVNYLEPILSTRIPVFTKKETLTNVSVVIENFGQVNSQECELVVIIKKDNSIIEKIPSKVPGIAPFEQFEVKLNSKVAFKENTQYAVSTIIYHKELKPSILSKFVVIGNDSSGD